MSVGESMQKTGRAVRPAIRRVARAVEPGDRRASRHRPWRVDLPVRRRALPAGRRAGAGQDAARAHAGQGARPEILAHSVHARPDAGRHSGHEHGRWNRPTAGGFSSFKKGRSSRRSAWRTKSTAPRPRRNRPCSKRCRKARSRVAGKVLSARTAVLRDGHAKPDRAGRHLSAARSPARPLFLQAGRRLFEPRGAGDDHRSHHARRDDRAEQGDGRRARSCNGKRWCAR